MFFIFFTYKIDSIFIKLQLPVVTLFKYSFI